MTHPHQTLSGKRMTTPRSAAIAGILFAALFTISLVLIRISLPARTPGSNIWPEIDPDLLVPALSLMPFAGIAFLWFMGVVRDRLGAYEDQFFSTIFYGSGLLFLAMIFAASAITGGIVASHLVDPAGFTSSEVYQFGRTIISQFFAIYALRMAGVFVISLGTIWLRTGLMPRWLTFMTYFFALILMLSNTLNLWMVLVFPCWVLVISLYILFINLKSRAPGASDGMTASVKSQE
jgi:hypothetical protein